MVSLKKINNIDTLADLAAFTSFVTNTFFVEDTSNAWAGASVSSSSITFTNNDVASLSNSETLSTLSFTQNTSMTVTYSIASNTDIQTINIEA